MILFKCDNCEQVQEDHINERMLPFRWIDFNGHFHINKESNSDWAKVIVSNGHSHFCCPECFIGYFFKIEVIRKRFNIQNYIPQPPKQD